MTLASRQDSKPLPESEGAGVRRGPFKRYDTKRKHFCFQFFAYPSEDKSNQEIGEKMKIFNS
jgi:hypothetical protein